MNSGRDSSEEEDHDSPVEVKKEPVENEDIKVGAKFCRHVLICLSSYT